MNSAARNVAAENARAAEEFRKRLEGLAFDMDETKARIVNQAVNVGLANTIVNTPVGFYLYAKGNTKVGGTLRRRWKKSKTHKEGGAVVGGYANSTSYAVYVNNGHRIVRNGVTVGLVQGKHMLEIGQRAAEKALPSIYNAEMQRIKRKSGF